MNEHLINRRSFLKRVGAGVAVAAAPVILPSRIWADAPSNKFNIALVGCGGRGHSILPEALRLGANLVALCDVNEKRIAEVRNIIAPEFPEAAKQARGYADYRELMAQEKSLDGVLIAIGPWWHAPMSTAFMKDGKHVYCEKPLTRLISEARALGQLARESKVATQMGTQGVASETFRRAVEIVQSGLIGSVREVHIWNFVNQLRPPSHDRPPGQDPVPAGFNWDFFLGPSPERPYKSNAYYPGCTQASVWFDFGSGLLGDFAVHTWQLPIRALKLGHPVRVEHNVPEPVRETYASNVKSRYDFAARGDMPAVSVWYCDTINRPPQEATADLVATYGKLPGLGAMLLGDKGSLYSGGWGAGNLMKLKGEAKMRGVTDHPAAKSLPMTEPRAPKQNHMLEWMEAAKGGPKTYQPLDIAAHSMEVLLPGIVSLRMERPIEWDGTNMKVPGAPEADKFIHTTYRRKWL